MDLCVIPPIAHLKDFPQKRHLVLSHLLVEPEYRTFYEERRKAGDYLILDNSAHENGIGEGAEKLLLQCMDLRPQEVVIPDALEDSHMTEVFAHQTLNTWFKEDVRDRFNHLAPSLMYVPQGKDPHDWKKCLLRLMSLHRTFRPCMENKHVTIGVSKDYASWPGGLAPLVRAALEFRDLKPDIHLLGVPHDYHVPSLLKFEFPQIRSVDTAKPFTWALRGLAFHGEIAVDPSMHAPRPEQYFHMTLSAHELDLAKKNVLHLHTLVTP